MYMDRMPSALAIMIVEFERLSFKYNSSLAIACESECCIQSPICIHDQTEASDREALAGHIDVQLCTVDVPAPTPIANRCRLQSDSCREGAGITAFTQVGSSHSHESQP